jgi:hypothetical protein
LVCTRVCTSRRENANAGVLDAVLAGKGEGTDEGGAGRESSAADQADPLAALAQAIATLSPADRARLIALLDAGPGDAI